MSDARQLIEDLMKVEEYRFSPLGVYETRIEIAEHYLQRAYLKGRSESASLAKELNTSEIIEKINEFWNAVKEPRDSSGRGSL